jgi:hypothetical protein
VEIVFEGKISSQLAKKKISSAQRSEQYLNQNYFFAGIYKKKNAYLTSYSTSFR